MDSAAREIGYGRPRQVNDPRNGVSRQTSASMRSPLSMRAALYRQRFRCMLFRLCLSQPPIIGKAKGPEYISTLGMVFHRHRCCDGISQ
jgi:hypothetical protein